MVDLDRYMCACMHVHKSACVQLRMRCAIGRWLHAVPGHVAASLAVPAHTCQQHGVRHWHTAVGTPGSIRCKHVVVCTSLVDTPVLLCAWV